MSFCFGKNINSVGKEPAVNLLDFRRCDIDYSLLQKLENQSECLKRVHKKACFGSFIFIISTIGVLKPGLFCRHFYTTKKSFRKLCLVLNVLATVSVLKSSIVDYTCFKREFFFTSLKQRILQNRKEFSEFFSIKDKPEDLTRLKTLYYFCLKNSKYKRFLVHLENFIKQREARILADGKASKKD